MPLSLSNSFGSGEKYQVSIWYFPSSRVPTFFTFVTSSCSLSAAASIPSCSSSDCATMVVTTSTAVCSSAIDGSAADPLALAEAPFPMPTPRCLLVRRPGSSASPREVAGFAVPLPLSPRSSTDEAARRSRLRPTPAAPAPPEAPAADTLPSKPFDTSSDDRFRALSLLPMLPLAPPVAALPTPAWTSLNIRSLSLRSSSSLLRRSSFLFNALTRALPIEGGETMRSGVIHSSMRRLKSR
mmetsp:Transcript_58808/g.124899  ORF Transcript_58808/g.124899 Transcript_58808/m.124899 type:complete len:240 (-) Transcript_58808:711-1430(-)